ncbi:MAG: TIGR00303 family protein [Candidatus Methanoplasma sp.]|jgi:uncharacterized protein (TIGR00303 family)|nr:TIGR00303 family protein [Candidatus Methanoplasma sp.]
MSDFELPPSLKIDGNEKIAKKILSEIWGKKGIFTCTVANTLTSTIPGISDAGDTPELTMFTPAADAELLVLGRTVCMKGIPINPGGIPTPATLTKAALELSKMPFLIVDGGSKVKPNLPCIEVGGECGQKVTTGKAVSNVKEVFENGKILGELLSHGNDFLVVSESCAGGTTTALAVLMAMGVVKENLVSSSSPNNPKQLKTDTVLAGLKAAGVEIGGFANDPLKAIAAVGDPMMPANVGMIIGAAKRIPVIVGGGTQMAAVIAVAVKLDPSIIGRIFQGTTRWLVDDPNSNIVKMIDSISPDIPIVSVQMDYSSSPYEGLQAYEWGYIKEGVGCGGASVSAIIQSSGEITCDTLLDKVHDIYRKIMNYD